jgi:hypothetical protein
MHQIKNEQEATLHNNTPTVAGSKGIGPAEGG